MTNMSTEDVRFLQERDAAARRLRAAAATALMLGVSESDIAALVTAGLDQVAGSTMTATSRDYAERLGVGLSAELLPAQRASEENDDTDVDAEEPDERPFVVTLHPALSRLLGRPAEDSYAA